MLCTFNKLKISNTFFRKNTFIHKLGTEEEGYRSIIDYIIINEKVSPISGTQLYRGNDISSEHFLIVSKINVFAKWRKT